MWSALVLPTLAGSILAFSYPRGLCSFSCTQHGLHAGIKWAGMWGQEEQQAHVRDVIMARDAISQEHGNVMDPSTARQAAHGLVDMRAGRGRTRPPPQAGPRGPRDDRGHFHGGARGRPNRGPNDHHGDGQGRDGRNDPNCCIM
jgi:hypothetical protein